jgi:hypothetical protein
MAAILIFIITDSVYTSNASAQTDETNTGTNRAINIQRTTSSGENVTDNDDVGNIPAQTNASIIGTNASTIGTNRAINIQRTTSSGENVTDNDDVGNTLIMPSTIINNFGGVAIDKFVNIFIADSRIVPF